MWWLRSDGAFRLRVRTITRQGFSDFLGLGTDRPFVHSQQTAPTELVNENEPRGYRVSAAFTLRPLKLSPLYLYDAADWISLSGKHNHHMCLFICKALVAKFWYQISGLLLWRRRDWLMLQETWNQNWWRKYCLSCSANKLQFPKPPSDRLSCFTCGVSSGWDPDFFFLKDWFNLSQTSQSAYSAFHKYHVIPHSVISAYCRNVIHVRYTWQIIWPCTASGISRSVGSKFFFTSVANNQWRDPIVLRLNVSQLAQTASSFSLCKVNIKEKLFLLLIIVLCCMKLLWPV